MYSPAGSITPSTMLEAIKLASSWHLAEMIVPSSASLISTILYLAGSKPPRKMLSLSPYWAQEMANPSLLQSIAFSSLN
jgi:hypothetical protein